MGCGGIDCDVNEHLGGGGGGIFISALIFLRGPHVGIVGGWVGLPKTLVSTVQNN